MDDASLAQSDEFYKKVEEIREVLLSYDDSSLTEEEQRSREVALFFINHFVENKKFRLYNYPLNQIWGVQLNLPTFLATKHTVDTAEDAENYLIRLEKVSTKVDQTMEGLVKRAEIGILPPRFIAEKVISGLQDFINTPAQENILCASFKEQLEKAKDNIAEDQQVDFVGRCVAALSEYVYPAYNKYLSYMDQHLPNTTADAGVWKFPDGDAYYQSQLKFFTTTNLTAAEIHQLGLAETARIQEGDS